MNTMEQYQLAERYASAGERELAVAAYRIVLRDAFQWPDLHSDMVLEMMLSTNSQMDPEEVLGSRLESAIHSKVVSLLMELQPDSALPHATRALLLDRVLYQSKSDQNDVAADQLDLAYLHLLSDQPKEAEVFVRQSANTDVVMNRSDEHTLRVASRSIHRGIIFADLGLGEDAARSCCKGVPVLLESKSIMGSQSILNAGCHILQDLGEHWIARDWRTRLIELKLELEGEDAHTGTLKLGLADVLGEMGQFSAALELIAEVSSNPRLTGKERADIEAGVARIKDAGRSISDSATLRRVRESWEKLSVGREVEEPFFDYFISFNTGDTALASELSAALTDRGLSTYMFEQTHKSGRQLSHGDVHDEIVTNLLKSRSMLLLCTAGSVTSDYVFFEIEVATELSVPIVSWYPEGTRIQPAKVSAKSDVSLDRMLSVLARLGPSRASLFGYGIADNSTVGVADSLIYRLLVMARDHPLHAAHDMVSLASKVRHLTRIVPVFVDRENRPLFSDAMFSGWGLPPKRKRVSGVVLSEFLGHWHPQSGVDFSPLRD